MKPMVLMKTEIPLEYGKNNMNDNLYKTKDLAESAALLIKKQSLVNFERVGKTCWFYFANREKCLLLSNNFFFGELTVNAREFYQTVLSLKNRIFAGE